MKGVPTIFFFLVLILVSLSFFGIIYPFLFSIGGAFLLAHLFSPLYLYFYNRFDSPQWASITTTLLVLSLVVLPLVGVAFMISVQVKDAYGFARRFLGENQNDFLTSIKGSDVYLYLEKQQWFISLIDLEKDGAIWERLYQFLGRSTDYFFGLMASVFTNLPSIFISVLVLVYLLYYLFIERERIITMLIEFVPTRENKETKDAKQVMSEMSRVIKATVYGTVFMGFLEGSFGALLFFIFSIPSAILWGVVMAILTMIPLVGANVILLPAGLYKIFSGEWISGLCILVIGVGGVLFAENIVKPQIVGNRAGLHPALVVLSSLGAIAVMGIVGFIVGPIVATLFLVLWRQFRSRMQESEST